MTRRDPDPVEPLERLVARIDATPAGSPDPETVPSGYPSLDRMLGGGLRRQDLIVLAGDVGSGKSALALGIAVRMARAGTPVLFISGEAEPDRILERALAMEGRASVDDLRQGRLDPGARATVGAAAVRLRDAPLALRPMLGGRFAELAETIEMVPPRALVVVDSIGLAPSPQPAARAEERTALVARALKGLALERDVALLVTAPLPRLRPGRPDPRPTLVDLGGVGIGQARRRRGAGDLPGRDVPPGSGRGGRDRAHRGEEPNRADRIRGPLLLSPLAPVRGPARPGVVAGLTTRAGCQP